MNLKLIILLFLGYVACQEKFVTEKPLPIIPLPWKRCCPTAGKVMTLDLHEGTLVNDYVLAGLTKPVILPNSRTQYRQKKCSHMADFKATFQSLPTCLQDWNQCMDRPICGKRMLKVELDIHEVRSSYIFNVGDSKSNNGWGGDSGHQKNDAEIMGFKNDTNIYMSDYCKSQAIPYPGLLNNAKTVTIWIGNEFTRIQSKDSSGAVIKDVQHCNRCLFALNWQADQCATCKNMDIYIALNNLIYGVHRSGHGVCKANISWECCQN